MLLGICEGICPLEACSSSTPPAEVPARKTTGLYLMTLHLE